MSHPVYYVVEGDTLPIFFDSFDGGTGASITLTGLAVTDIEIYRDGSTTQRASDAGYALLDTDGIDFDGVTGIHGFSVDLSDNTDSGFYVVGSWYHVVVSSVTIDAQTVNFIAAAFRIVSATRGMAGTALPNAAADAAGGLPISDAGGLDLDAQLGKLVGTIATGTHNPQSGDAFARLGAPAGASVSADVAAVKAETAAILDDTDLIDDGTSGLAKIATDVAAILVDTGTTLQGELDGIQADTEDIQTRLPAALVGGRIDATVDATGLEAGALALINTEVDTALTDYDAPTRTELTSDINSVLSKLLKYVQLLARKDSAIATDNATEVTAINADGGSGAGAFANTTDSQEAIRDNMGTAQTGDSFARIGAPAGASVSADIAAVKVDTAATLLDTNELQTDWANGGRLDLLIDAILLDTGTTLDARLTTVKDILEGDRQVDTTATPWQLVITKQGTGGMGVGTELLRMDLTTAAGSNVTSASHIVGNAVTPP